MMPLVIQKFGGTSVADTHHIFNVAKKVIDVYNSNNNVVVVVSAQGDTTNKLQSLIDDVTSDASKRETDALLSAGEQISAALLAISIQKLGYPAISLTGWQAGFLTDSDHTNAKIKSINTKRIQNELENKNIVIIAGFQGLNDHNDITTLGRGGSDTSAVALAAALNADICKIYTDVDGVYTADPRIVPSAKKWPSLSYDTMFDLAFFGAQVLNDRSIETAKQHNVEVEVLSSLSNSSAGTIITKNNPKKSNMVSGISLKNHLAKITVSIPDEAHDYENIIATELIQNNINFDKGLKTVGKKNPTLFNFIINEIHINDFLNIMKDFTKRYNNTQISYEKNKSKISVVNISESLNLNIASIIFETLSEMHIDAEMVACDQKRVSVIVTSEYASSAINAIHSKLFEEDIIL